jgi:hypothetical protein
MKMKTVVEILATVLLVVIGGKRESDLITIDNR